MKKIIFITLMSLIQTFSSWAQNNSATNDQIYNTLRGIVQNQSDFRGQPLSIIYNTLNQDNIPVNWFSTRTTSPWTDQNGIGYLKHVILYNVDLSYMQTGNTYFQVFIEVMETNINDYEYLRNLPSENTVEAFLNLTSTLHIKKIYFDVVKRGDDGWVDTLEHCE